MPEWKKAATALKGIASMGAVDMDQHKEVGAPYDVTGFPTIKSFGAGDKAIDYNGGRDAKGLASFVLKELKTIVRNRLGLKKKEKKEKGGDTKVITLTDDNFEEQVVNSEDFWLVEFYAPWCGHCKTLAPEWKKAAASLDGLVKLGALDATAHTKIGEKYEIKGFPTIKAFPSDGDRSAQAYEGGRTAKDIIEWCAVRGGFDVPEAGAAAPEQKKAAPEKKNKKKSASAVVELTEATFQSEVMESEDLWLVEFYAPWCGHCKSLAPEWKKAAKELEGKVKLGAVDATAQSVLGQKYEVKGYPTIKVFPKGEKGDPVDYNGGRTKDTIVAAAYKLLGEEAPEAEKEEGPPTANVVLTTDAFDSLVMESNDLWMVEFFAPWCGHCKNLVPEWAKASLELEGKVKLGTVDATVETAIATRFEVTGYPTIKFFSNGEAILYEGARVANGIVKNALEQLAEHTAEPRAVTQIVSQEGFDQECATGLCVIAVLPHILDTQASGRNEYLDMLKAQATTFKRSDVGFLWADAMTQESLEKALDVSGSGYPALAVMNKKKGRYVPFFSSFSTEGLTEFLTRVVAQKERSAGLNDFTIASAEEWDGKDGEMPVEENYDDEETDGYKEEL